jgi:hypothetical protein
MTDAGLAHWVRVDITLMHKEDLSTELISLINRAEISDISAEDTYPLLLSISRLGASSDREMVLPEAGSLRLLDSIGSLAVDRKFSDLLQHYEIIDQPITVLYKATATTDNNPVFDTTQFTGSDIVYAGKVSNYDCQIDQDLPVMDIRFDARIFDKRIVTKVINTTDHASAPISSIGKALPIIIGEDIQVKPIAITASGATSPQYAYATTLSTEHPVGGISSYYIKDTGGRYQSITSAVDVNTAIVTNSRTHVGGSFRPNIQMAVRLNMSINDTYIITQAKVRFNGDNNGALIVNGVYELTILDHDDINDIPGNVIGVATVNKNDYQASVRGAADFDVTFAFNKPVPLVSSTYFYLGCRQTKSSGDTGYFNFPAVDAADVTRYRYLQSEYASSEQYGNLWTTKGNSKDVPQYDLYGLKFTDSPGGAYIDSEGLGEAYFTITQKAAIVTNPDISKLDILLQIDGLKDDSSGSITGSASSVITTAHHAIELLSQEWNGSAWAASDYWDFTSLSSTYNSGHTIAGSTEGAASLGELVREICRNSAYKTVLKSNGKLAPYAWGSDLTTVTRFSQENSKVLNVSKFDSSYVVNNVKIGYNKQLIYFDSINLASQGIPSDFTSVFNINSSTAGYPGLIGNSASLYGERYLSNDLFRFINTEAQAARLAIYYLTNFNQPPIVVDLEVPFEYFSILENTYVVEIKHPSLPTYYGGSSNAKMSYFEGEEVDPTPGGVMSRAKTYRAQIEAMKISFNPDAVPTLILSCRLLLNSNDPT